MPRARGAYKEKMTGRISRDMDSFEGSIHGVEVMRASRVCLMLVDNGCKENLVVLV